MASGYGRSAQGRRPAFGRVDPFCLFAVLPMLVLAGFAVWGGIAWAAVAVVVFAVLVLLIDARVNRPAASYYSDDEDDYDEPARY
jgi:hypothetical protein